MTKKRLWFNRRACFHKLQITSVFPHLITHTHTHIHSEEIQIEGLTTRRNAQIKSKVESITNLKALKIRIHHRFCNSSTVLYGQLIVHPIFSNFAAYIPIASLFDRDSSVPSH